MSHLSNIDRWRLSRIAEEIDTLSFSSPDDGGSSEASSRSRESTLGWSSRPGGEGQLPSAITTPSSSLLSRSSPSENIYSKTLIGLNVTDAGNFVCSERDFNCQGKDALRFIKEKYDSLGKVKVKKPSGAYSVQAPDSTVLSYGGNTAGSVCYSVSGVEEDSVRHCSTRYLAPLVITGANRTIITSPTLNWTDVAQQPVVSPLTGGQSLFKHAEGLGFISSQQNSSAGRVTQDHVSH